MIKLEQTHALVQARAVITIESGSTMPTVQVTAKEGARAKNGKGDWEERPDLAKQSVVFVGDSGPVEMTSTVPEAQAVHVGAVYRAVCEVELARSLTTAYEKGDRSRELTALSLVRVVEVWTSPEKCAWRTPERAGGAANGKTVSLAGDKAAIR